MTSNDLSDEEPELTTDVDLTQINSNSYLSKLCIKFSKGYKSYTITQLSTSTLTIIALALPYIFHTCGMISGAIIFSIVSAISFYTMTLMLEMIMKTNAISYYHFLHYNISKGLSYFYLGVNFIYGLSAITIMCSVSIGGTVDLVQGLTKVDFVYRIVIAVVFAIIQFAFAVKPFEFVKLIAQYMMLIAVILVFMLCLVVMFIDCKEIKGTAELFKNGKFDVLYVVGIIFISFNSHNNIIECFKVFNMQTKRRGNKVILMHFIFILLFFLTFAYVWYFFFYLHRR